MSFHIDEFDEKSEAELAEMKYGRGDVAFGGDPFDRGSRPARE
ncbi:hypothetical protein [Halorussus litoreus]|nr:hypothetical protein [Halorussus litoreus]